MTEDVFIFLQFFLLFFIFFYFCADLLPPIHKIKCGVITVEQWLLNTNKRRNVVECAVKQIEWRPISLINSPVFYPWWCSAFYFFPFLSLSFFVVIDYYLVLLFIFIVVAFIVWIVILMKFDTWRFSLLMNVITLVYFSFSPKCKL